MLTIEKFDGTKTYMFPSGKIATPEVIRAQFPAVEQFVHVIEANGEVCQAVQNLSALRGFYQIDPALTDDEAIAALQTLRNTPPVPAPSPEERIAAALEYQNLLNL